MRLEFGSFTNTHLCCVATCVTRSEFCAIAHPPVRGTEHAGCALSAAVPYARGIPYRISVRGDRCASMDHVIFLLTCSSESTKTWLWLFLIPSLLPLLQLCGVEGLLLEGSTTSQRRKTQASLSNTRCECLVRCTVRNNKNIATCSFFTFPHSRPMVTGTSVLGITFNGGVMLAADTLGK